MIESPRFGAGAAIRRAALAVALGAAFLAGCAAPQSTALRSALAPGSAGDRALERDARVGALPLQARIASVPFVAQDAYQCGPAALAMVLGAAGRTVALATLIDAVYLPARKGSLQAEMLAQPRREGMLAVPLAPRLDTLLQTVADGTPVLVFQNLGLSWAPVWHYAVLIGYDLRRGEVVLHSGTEAASAISLETFERTWARAGHWAITVTDPARVPRTVDPGAALRAAVALERIDRAAALRAYETLFARAPHDRFVGFARANALHADSQSQAAAAAYRALLAEHPGFADAWNNLAHALADVGDVQAAREAADRAVSLGGPSIGVYRQTAARMHAITGAAAR